MVANISFKPGPGVEVIAETQTEGDPSRASAARPVPLMPAAANEPDESERATHRIHGWRPALWGWMLLVFGFGGVASWALLAPLDQGVSAGGVVVVSGKRKTVQHPTGGIVSEILVRDGDTVRAGQPLLMLNTTMARSQLETVRAQWLVSRAVERRLVAERDGAASVSFPSSLLAEAGEGAAQAIALQRRLFDTRRSALRSELAVIEESIAGLEAQIRGTEAARAAKQAQIAILSQELEGQRKLAEDGFLPRNRVLEQERLLAQLQGGIAQDEAGIQRGQRGVGELRLRQVALQQSFRQQVETELTEVQKEVGALTSRMDALRFELGNTEVRSPVDGIVVGLSVHTAGGVVQAGAPLMQIVPGDEPLRVEAQLPTEMIDSVRQGLQVDIMFPAFNASVTPNVPGIVQGVSADVLTEERTGKPYYRLDVDVTEEGMDKLAEHEIKPGMPAMVFVRTGERTAFNYLIKPLRDRLQTALTEE